MAAFEAIASTTIGTEAATISFTSIPSSYEHLQLRAYVRTDRGFGGNQLLFMRFNSDTSSNYAYHQLSYDGVSPAATGGASSTLMYCGYATGVLAPTGVYASFVVDLLDYASTNKHKTMRSLAGNDLAGGGFLGFHSGVWMSTSAISSIQFGLVNSSAKLVTGTVVSLYGLRSS